MLFDFINSVNKMNRIAFVCIVLSHNLWFNITMKKYKISKFILIMFLVIMAGMIGAAVFFKDALVAFMKQPAFLRHARFVHISAVTIFFTNAVVGMIWEHRSLASNNKKIILHTYNTVTVLDSIFSSPLIILSILGGLSLSFQLGELMQIGWLSVSFVLFLFSGLIWVVTDISTQYKVKRLLAGMQEDETTLPADLIRVMKLRAWIGFAGVLPLAAAFVLMVYKPEMMAVADWFR
jgi:uncharacterized membrane protein